MPERAPFALTSSSTNRAASSMTLGRFGSVQRMSFSVVTAPLYPIGWAAVNDDSRSSARDAVGTGQSHHTPAPRARADDRADSRDGRHQQARAIRRAEGLERRQASQRALADPDERNREDPGRRGAPSGRPHALPRRE